MTTRIRILTRKITSNSIADRQVSKNGFFWDHSSSSFFFLAFLLILANIEISWPHSWLIRQIYYMAESTNPAFWLATRAGKMGLSCPLGISRLGPARKKHLFRRIINSSLTKFVRSRWLDTGLVLFYVFIDLNFVSRRKRTWPVSRHLHLTLGK